MASIWPRSTPRTTPVFSSLGEAAPGGSRIHPPSIPSLDPGTGDLGAVWGVANRPEKGQVEHDWHEKHINPVGVVCKVPMVLVLAHDQMPSMRTHRQTRKHTCMPHAATSDQIQRLRSVDLTSTAAAGLLSWPSGALVPHGRCLAQECPRIPRSPLRHRMARTGTPAQHMQPWL